MLHSRTGPREPTTDLVRDAPASVATTHLSSCTFLFFFLKMSVSRAYISNKDNEAVMDGKYSQQGSKFVTKSHINVIIF